MLPDGGINSGELFTRGSSWADPFSVQNRNHIASSFPGGTPDVSIADFSVIFVELLPVPGRDLSHQSVRLEDPMSESAQLSRQWRLLRMLADSKTGFTISELQKELGISIKTMRRDLAVLANAGFRVAEATEEHGRKRWRIAGFQEDLVLNITDMLSVYMARQFLEPLAGTPFWDGQQRVFIRIRQALGDQAIQYLQKLSHSVLATSAGASDYRRRGEMIDQLMVAIEDRLISLITYRSEKALEPVTQEICPQGFVYHRGSLYLVAWSNRRGEIRTYKVDRMERVEATKQKATGLENFSLKEWLKGSFGVYRSNSTQLQTVRIRFAREVARYVQESGWHHSQQTTARADGSLIGEFRVVDTAEIKRWIMSFGPNATVLEPKALVEEIESDLNIMLKHYAAIPECGGVRGSVH